MIKGTEIIKKILKEYGYTTLFGYPGGAIMPFFDEIYEDKDIRVVLMRHEQMAGHAAEGYARVKGDLGLCVTTSGPGATNTVTALANAYYDSSPIMVFSGQVPTKLIGNDAFQEADVVGATMAITKQNYQVKDVNNLGKIFKEAIHIANSGRPGPVFIDLPKDVQVADCSLAEPIPENIHITGYNPKEWSSAVPRQINRALDYMMNAQYPVILAGGGVAHANAHKELEELVSILNIPVVYTMMGKGVISDDHPYVLGMLGMHGRKRANFAMCEADVILALGTRFSDRITGDLNRFPGQSDAKIIHIDIDTAEIGKNVQVDVPIVSDLKPALEELLNQLKDRMKNGGIIKSWWYKWIKDLKDSDGIPNVTNTGPHGLVIPEKVMYELNDILEPDDIVVTEVGQNQMYAAHYLNIRKPRTWISSGGLGTMGFGFHAAIGASVAVSETNPEAEVWLVAGDGSFQMNLHELSTVKSADIKVNIIIMNNEYLGMVRQWQELFFDKRYAGTDLACVGPECERNYWPDFIKLADAYGLEGIRVSKPSQVKAALERAKKSKETVVIEVLIEPESNVLPMLRPGGALDSFLSRTREEKSIYDWYGRLPRTDMECKNYCCEIAEEDDVDYLFQWGKKKEDK
ncbi:MAG: biosynthetic-type acetolactate synthase large subunit [Candidatus Lokiarchaeota archaeon]|nr:biosynthetic-type acetolactate synthase large subunit [Candidatus Lokiarchaeota archaeon]